MSRLLPALAAPAAPAEEKAPATAPAPRNLTPQSIRGRPYRDSWDIERAIREGMQRITWVFRCVHVRATKSARLPIVMRRDNPYDGEQMDEHPLLPLLNAYPNSEESAFIFRYRLSAQVDLNRRGAFVELQRSKLDDILAMRLLPTTTIPVPSYRGVERFDVMLDGRKAFELPPEDVVWVRHPHPTDSYGGMTPLEAAGIAVDSEWLAKLYQRNFLANNAALGKLILVAGDAEVDELQARVDARSGPGQAGRSVVMEATTIGEDGGATGAVGGVEVIDMAISPQEASYIEMRNLGKEEICSAYGLPVSVATMQAADRTFENASAEEKGVWRHTIIDHCEILDRPFDRVDNDPTSFVGRDISSVWVLQLDEIEREKHLADLADRGLIVPDEFREETDREPYEFGGDVALRSLTLFPTAGFNGASSPGDKAAVMVGRRQAKTSDVTIGGEVSDVSIDTVQFGPWQVDAKRLATRRTERARQIAMFEKQGTRLIRTFFNRQEKAVLEKLRGRKVREGTRHWRVDGEAKVPAIVGGDGTKVVSADDIFDLDRWNEQIADDVGGLVEAVVEHFGEDTFDTVTDVGKSHVSTEQKADEAFDPASAAIRSYLLSRQNQIKGVNDTTYASIVRALAKGEEAGETIDGLAGLVGDVFEQARGGRAITIARTEVISAANAGAVEGAKQTDVVESKVWLAAHDARTREDHAAADGQTVGLDEKFDVGGVEMAQPGDPDAPPEQTINCRCTVTFAVEGGPIL